MVVMRNKELTAGCYFMYFFEEEEGFSMVLFLNCIANRNSFQALYIIFSTTDSVLQMRSMAIVLVSVPEMNGSSSI